MSITLTPYDDGLYGASNYGGVTVSGFGFFDQPGDRASTAAGMPAALLFGQPAPGQVRT